MSIKNKHATFLPKIRTARWLDTVALAFGSALFAIMSLWTITRSSIWYDEAFGTYAIQFNFLDIATFTASDVHPPVYYWLLKCWTMLFGYTELSIRSMSLVAALVAIVFLFLLARRLFGRKVAWLTLLLVILSPMLLRYSQDARMYTLSTAIVVVATYVLTIARQSRRRWLWVLYGVLVSLGMWVHYFTVLMWVSHWIWHAITTYQLGVRGKKWLKAFFNLRWVGAYALAAILYVPWIPSMIMQLRSVQERGFWIHPVGADTGTNYLTNVLFYEEHARLSSLLALVLGLVLVIIATASVRAFRVLKKSSKQNYLLVVCMTFIPVIVLFIASMPPLESSFVERYLLPATLITSLYIAASIMIGFGRKRILTSLTIIIIIAALLVGIGNVYRYGNFNKNTNRGNQLTATMRYVLATATPGIPIVVNEGKFYEAVFYETPEHPVYFMDLKNEALEQNISSMRSYNDRHRINSLETFMAKYSSFWIVTGKGAVETVVTPSQTWKQLQYREFSDPIDQTVVNRAILYQAR